MNLYANLDMLKAELGKSTTGDDTVLLRLLERASREIDRRSERHFYSEIATRVFDGSGSRELWVDDLISVTTLKADDDGDGTYELTLASSTDYWLWPNNPRQNEPYTRIDLNPESTQLGRWPKARRRVQLAGRFGYSNETETAGTLGAAIGDTTGTSVTMAAGHSVKAGDTIVVGTEHMYVSAVVTNALTVVRGVNGTTAATAVNGAAVSKRRFDRAAEMAAIVRAADLWRGTQTGYAQVAADQFGGWSSNLAYAQFRGLLQEIARHPMVVI